MIQTLQTRLLLWKKQWFSLLFWLLFPLGATIFLVLQILVIQDDVRVPIGIVLEDSSELAEQLVENIKKTPHLRPVVVTEREGIQQLATDKLDSLFIIRKDYLEKINRGQRQQLLTSYQTDFSFAYAPVRETMISFMQQDFVRADTVNTILQMGEIYEVTDEWLADDIITRSQVIEAEQALLTAEFYFVGEPINKSGDTKYLFDPLGLWALFAGLATFMLFDWVLKENNSPTMQRLIFSRLSAKTYFLYNFLLYTGILLLFDFVSLLALVTVLQETVTGNLIGALIVYRFTLNSVIFLLSWFQRSPYIFYTSGFVISLMATIFSGVIIPMKDNYLKYFHPVMALQNGLLFNGILGIGILGLIVWLLRKENRYA